MKTQLLNRARSWFDMERLPRRLFFIVFLLLPLVIFPFYNLPGEIVKRFWLAIGVSVIVFFSLIKAYRDQNWRLPRNLIALGFGLVWVATLVSAIFSDSPFMSFLGFGFERDSFITVSLLILAALAPILIYQKKEDLPKFGFWLSLVALTVIVLEVIFLWLANYSLTAFVANYLGLIGGNWYEEISFFGLVVILCLGLLGLFPRRVSGRSRFLTILVLVASLAWLALINFWTVWLLLAVFSFALVVLLIRRYGGAGIFSASLITLIISLSFLTWGGQNSWLGRSVLIAERSARINVFEVRPNWTGTFDVARSSLKNSPILGIGPVRFWRAWNLYKPAGVNLSPFWSSDFNFGVGYVPSMAITGGWLGLLSWLILLGAILAAAGRGLRRFWRQPEEENHGLLLFALLPVLYLWTLLVFRAPSLVILTLAFVFLGWWLAVEKEAGVANAEWLLGQNDLTKKIWRGLSWPALVFIGVLILWFLSGLMAQLIFLRSGALARSGQLDSAMTWGQVSALISRSDIYPRQLAEIEILRLNRLLQATDITPEQARADFATFFNDAVARAETAKRIDPNNYANWLTAAHVYSVAVPLQIDGAETQAVAAYQKALALNPTNPSIYYEMARLSLLAKKNTEAKSRLGQALGIKPNYLDASFAIAQLNLNDGQINQAVAEATKAVAVAPGDYNALFLLGYLQYQQGNIGQAQKTLAQTLSIQPDLADAKYFIGLSYDRLGRRDEALTVFRELVAANPDNQDLARIIANLAAGRPALSTGAPATAEPAAADKTKAK